MSGRTSTKLKVENRLRRKENLKGGKATGISSSYRWSGAPRLARPGRINTKTGENRRLINIRQERIWCDQEGLKQGDNLPGKRGREQDKTLKSIPKKSTIQELEHPTNKMEKQGRQ